MLYACAKQHAPIIQFAIFGERKSGLVHFKLCVHRYTHISNINVYTCFTIIYDVCSFLFVAFIDLLPFRLSYISSRFFLLFFFFCYCVYHQASLEFICNNGLCVCVYVPCAIARIRSHGFRCQNDFHMK